MRCALVIFISLLSCEGVIAQEPLDWIKQLRGGYAGVKDYTATFRRQEMVRGELRPNEAIFLKFREPMQVYMKVLDGPSKGREAIYVGGRDGNRVLVHEPGGISSHFTVLLATDSPYVMERNRHTAEEIGIGYMTELITSNFERAGRAGDLEVRDLGTQTEDGRTLRVFEGILPSNPTKNYYGYRATVAIDEEWKLPVAVKVYDWDDKLVENYHYSDIRVNVGLSDKDFDPANPDYNFPNIRIRR